MVRFWGTSIPLDCRLLEPGLVPQSLSSEVSDLRPTHNDALVLRKETIKEYNYYISNTFFVELPLNGKDLLILKFFN